MSRLQIKIPEPHAKQRAFIDHPAKRKVIRAGRRGGKTVGIGIAGVEWFLQAHRVLYAAPTQEQVARFWAIVTRALAAPVRRGVFKKNESEHFIEVPGTEQRIKAKTAWNADTLRGDYADKLIFDEWQLINEDAWGLVGAPMMLDTNGDAVFIYTPPSLHSRSVSKADDPQHAAKLFRKAAALQASGDPRWAAFHFTSHDNPHLSRSALDEIAQDMTALAYRMEIMAEDVDEAPGALWTRATIEANRVAEAPALRRVVVAVDPSVSSEGDCAGIIVGGEDDNGHGYVLADKTVQGSPLTWAAAAVGAYHEFRADRITAEKNQGGEMVELTLRQVDGGIDVPIKLVHASRGKQARAEPVSARYERGQVHHVGSFAALEDEMCLWLPGDNSPNRLDALVWGMTDLILSGGSSGLAGSDLEACAA